MTLDETHDPARRSLVSSANAPGCDFPIQNLPFGVFRPATGPPLRVGVAIGDQILDVAAAASRFHGLAAEAAQSCMAPHLNALMSLGPRAWSALRLALSRSLSTEHGDKSIEQYLTAMAQAEIGLPVAIGDFTDFFASIFHASNAGRLFRPDNPLMPNYKYVPVAYHSRASSVVVSGTTVRRPSGQAKGADDPAPRFGPSRNLDYECELGFFIGTGNALGEPVPVGRAGEHVFGFCLLNDWSARDIQGWESQPLGPFLGKSFATTISPWIVTMEALAPFRVPAFARAEGDPTPLPYLDSPAEHASGGFDIDMEVLIATARMRQANVAPARLSLSNARDLYWTIAQMVAHHTSNGCNLRPGDLCGSGTVSGRDPSAYGSILELAWRGTKPITLPNGEVRRFLEDGDEIILTARCARAGAASIGFGECRGIVEPAAG